MSTLEPGSLPKWVSRSERRKWDEADRQDADRQMNRRPNEDQDAPSRWTRCQQSKYQAHRIVGRRGNLHCEFCLQQLRDCLVKP